MCASIQDRFAKMGPILKSAIDENPVPSLAEVARRLGYSYTAIVQRHEPGLWHFVYSAAQICSGKAGFGGARTITTTICARFLQRLGHHGTVHARALPDSRACNYWSATGRFRPRRFPDTNWPVYGVRRLGRHQTENS